MDIFRVMETIIYITLSLEGEERLAKKCRTEYNDDDEKMLDSDEKRRGFVESWIAFWVVAVILFALVEAATANLVTIWFAAGALVAAVVAACGANVLWQFVTFLLVSGIVLAATRPLVRNFRSKEDAPTNANRIVGKEAQVIEDLDAISGTGQVKVLGQIWSAKAEDERRIQKGAKVVVCRIEGVKAVVKEKEKER